MSAVRRPLGSEKHEQYSPHRKRFGMWKARQQAALQVGSAVFGHHLTAAQPAKTKGLGREA